MKKKENNNIEELNKLRKENEELKNGLNSIFKLVSRSYAGLQDSNTDFNDPTKLLHILTIIFGSLETQKTLLDQNLKALNSVSDGIVIFNPSGKIVFSNKSFGKIFKVKKTNLTDVHWRIIFVENYYFPIKNLVREINDNYPVHQEIIVKVDQKNQYLKCSVYPLNNGNILANVSDITSEKEKQYKISEQTTLLKSANEFIGICDGNFQFKFLNDYALKMFNISSEPRDNNFFDFLETNDQKKIRLGLEHQSNWEGEITLSQKKVNKSIYCRLQYFEATGLTPGGYYILLQDITESKKTIKKLETAKDVAENNAKIKQQFLANMSHEIRTPMNAIIGLSSLLQDTPLGVKQKELSDSIQMSAQNLLVILNDILDISKIESGNLNIEKIPFKFQNTIEVIRKTFSHKIEEKGLKFIEDINEDIPPYLIGDPTRLSQVLLNLVSNSIKFTEKGIIGFIVDVIKKSKNSIHLRFIIEDSGIGISPKKQKDIFLPFTQENDSTTRKYGGTGLGLAIVKQLIDLQKGQIKLKSTQGKGSTFMVDIPFGISENLNAEIGTFNSHFDNSKIKNAKIIMAEDYPMNQLLAQNLFEKWGLNLKIVNNGKELLKAIEKRNYDIVLMDIQMPEMDGLEATRKLRQRGEKVPVIAITAHAFEEERKQCLNAGMNDFLAKPFNEKDLVEKLITYLNLKPGDLESVKNIYDTEARIAITNRTKSFGTNYLRDMGTGDESFIQEMLEMFVDQVPVILSDIIDAFNKKDKENFAKYAHTIQSSMGLVDRNDLRDQFKQIELYYKDMTSLIDPNKIVIDAINQSKEVVSAVSQHLNIDQVFSYPEMIGLEKIEDELGISINLEKVKALGEDNNNFASDMLKLYIDQCKEQLATIETSTSKKDLNTIGLTVHNMIGSFELIGCDKLVTYAINIEEICKNQKFNDQLKSNLKIFKNLTNQSFDLVIKEAKAQKINLT